MRVYSACSPSILQHYDSSFSPLLLQLTSREPEQFTDLEAGGRAAAKAGVRHGDLVYLLTTMEREVAPVHRKSAFESRPFGTSLLPQRSTINPPPLIVNIAPALLSSTHARC